MNQIRFETKDNKYGLPINYYVPASKQAGDVMINMHATREELQVARTLTLILHIT